MNKVFTVTFSAGWRSNQPRTIDVIADSAQVAIDKVRQQNPNSFTLIAVKEIGSQG